MNLDDVQYVTENTAVLGTVVANASASALNLAASPRTARPLPYCAPLASGGRWELGPAGGPPVQGAWLTPGCALRPWGPDDLRNRRIAIVGDSVSRFLMFDIASAAFGCPPLVDCNPRKCSSGVPEGAALGVPHDEAWGTADTISPPSVGEHLATHLPNARLELIQGGDHAFPNTMPVETATAIARHLA